MHFPSEEGKAWVVSEAAASSFIIPPSALKEEVPRRGRRWSLWYKLETAGEHSRQGTFDLRLAGNSTHVEGTGRLVLLFEVNKSPNRSFPGEIFTSVASV